jgi:hypothetical protein
VRSGAVVHNLHQRLPLAPTTSPTVDGGQWSSLTRKRFNRPTTPHRVPPLHVTTTNMSWPPTI